MEDKNKTQMDKKTKALLKELMTKKKHYDDQKEKLEKEADADIKILKDKLGKLPYSQGVLIENALEDELRSKSKSKRFNELESELDKEVEKALEDLVEGLSSI